MSHYNQSESLLIVRCIITSNATRIGIASRGRKKSKILREEVI